MKLFLFILLTLLTLCSHAQAQVEDIFVSSSKKASTTSNAVQQSDSSSDILKKIDDVLLGKFPKQSYKVPVPLAQKSWAKQKVETTAGVKTFKWQRGKIYKVITREGMGTVFQIPQWDTIDQSILSDKINFQQREMNNPSMLYLEPLSAGADTSLKIVGKSGNIYGFYLSSENVLSPNISDQIVYIDTAFPEIESFSKKDISSVREESLSSLLKTSNPEWVRQLKFDPTKVRHDLEMRGDKELAPIIVFRDDRFTYLDYGIEHEDQLWGVAYQVVDRVDMPVNVRKSPEGRYMVIETTNPITLRYGELVVCIKRIQH